MTDLGTVMCGLLLAVLLFSLAAAALDRTPR